MRALYYRQVETKVFRVPDGFRWEAWLLIRGIGKAIRGHVSDARQLPAAIQAAVAVAYLQITGEKLPSPDGQLPLL